MKTALLIIDIQNDYFPGGKMELVNMEQVTAVAHRVIEHARAAKHSIFHIQHIFKNSDAPFFVANTDGVKLHKSIQQLAGESHIVKPTPNSFNETDLDAQLKKQGIDTLIIIGAMTHICIDATAKAATDLGYKVIVISDASATRDLTLEDKTIPAAQVQASFLAGMNGVFAEVMTAEKLMG